MSAVSNILKNRRKELGLTLSQIADQMGVSEATVQRWESGNIKNLRHERVGPLAELLRVSPAVLMGWEDETPEEPDSPPPGLLPFPTMKKIPRLGRIACGQPIMTEENFDGYDDIPESIHADFSLICSGDSMINARIRDGDIVYIRLQEQVENGEIAAVYIDGETTLKRVYLSPGQLVLQAENPQYAPMVYTGPELENIRIIGKAVGFTSVI